MSTPAPMQDRPEVPAEHRLTLCVIARNEQDQIEGCLASARGVADEIVVADTGSQDATVEIARRMGARVVESPWEDDFSAARNAAIEAVQTGWILMMDADERIIEGSAAGLREQIRTAGKDEDAFGVRIDNLMDGGGSNSCRIVRLFRNQPEFRYRGRIHEEVVSSIAERHGGEIQPRPAEVVLTHDGYLFEQRGAKQKKARNLRLLKSALRSDPRQAWMNFAYARELLMVRGERVFPGAHFPEALRHLQEARRAALENRVPVHLAAGIDSTLAAAYTADFRPADAVALLSDHPPMAENSAEGVILDFARARARLALAGEDRDMLRQAQKEFEALDGRSFDTGFIDVDARLTGVFARERRAEATGRLGEMDEALALLDQADAMQEGYGGPQVRRAELLLLHGEPQAGLQAYTDALKRDEHDPEAWLGIARLLNLMAQLDQALECSANALHLVPLWGPALLERAATHLLQNAAGKLMDEMAAAREASPEADVACLLAEALTEKGVTGLRTWPQKSVERAMMALTRSLAGGGRPDLLRQLQSALGPAQGDRAAG